MLQGNSYIYKTQTHILALLKRPVFENEQYEWGIVDAYAALNYYHSRTGFD
jgi:hypothetical protein